MFGISSQQ